MAEISIKKKEDPRRTVQETVVRMQAHYAKTGTYRTEDLNCVLGDPIQTVSGTVRPHTK